MKKFFIYSITAVFLIVITVICTKAMLSAFDLESTDQHVKVKVTEITSVDKEGIQLTDENGNPYTVEFKTVKFSAKYLSGDFTGNVDEAFECYQSVNPGDLDSGRQVEKGDIVYVIRDKTDTAIKGDFKFEYYSRSNTLLMIAVFVLAIVLLLFAVKGFKDLMLFLFSAVIGAEVIIAGFAKGDFAILPLILIILLIIALHSVNKFGLSIKTAISALGSVISIFVPLIIFNALYGSLNISGAFDDYTVIKNSNSLNEVFNYKTVFVCTLLLAVLGGVIYVCNATVSSTKRTYKELSRDDANTMFTNVFSECLKASRQHVIPLMLAVVLGFIASNIPYILEALSLSTSSELFFNSEQFTIICLGVMYATVSIAIASPVVIGLCAVAKTIKEKLATKKSQ